MNTSLARTAQLARPRARRLALGVLTAVLATLCSLGLLATSAWLISRAAQHPQVAALSLAVVAVRGFAVGRAVLRYAERLVNHDATLRVLTDVRVHVYRLLVPLAPDGLGRYSGGDLLRRLVADVDSMADLPLRGLIPCASALLAALVCALGLGLILPGVGIAVLVAALLLALLLPWATGRATRRVEGDLAARRAAYAGELVDTVEGLEDLLAYGALEAQVQRLALLEDELGRDLARSGRRQSTGVASAVLVGGLLVALSLLLAVPAVRSGAVSGVLLEVVVLLPLGIVDALLPVPQAASEITRSRTAAERVFAVTDTAPPVAEPARPEPLLDGPYALAVRGLELRRGGRTVVRGLDLELPPGRRVAVVGPSGSGKTTFAHALVRLLDPSDGVVALNGTDTRTLRSDDVRRVVGLVTEDAHAFDSTVWENVRLARPQAGRDDVRDALRRARLLDWVEAQPEGLDTPVGAHGDRMSGGERQRLALARAFLADFPILVVDEPGEHVEVDTADRITADLLAETADRSVVLITHRLAGLDAVDEVLVLDEGQVVQRGRHADLVTAPGRYREWWLQESALEGYLCAP